MSNFENPYQSPSQFGSSPRPDLSGKVKPPAIALLVVAPLGIVFALFDLVIRLINLSSGNVPVIFDQPGAQEGAMVGAWIGAGGDVIAIICQIVVIIGALNMMKMQNYGLALTACVLSVIPCLSACCVLGMPFGIWGLIVLNDPNVKSAFRG